MKGLFIILLVFALSACGGGGGGSGGNSGGASSSSSQNTLVANAGPDKTVNAGERIDIKSNALVTGGTGFTLSGSSLEVKGASTNAKDVVLISWTQTQGPSISLMTNGTTTADAYFIAPSTGTANSISVTFKLTLTTVDGTKAEDSVTFTVNRVNSLPTVDAGPDIKADSGTTVVLKGMGTDTDGTIAGYNWVQTAGDIVEITGNSAAEATFVAPDTLSETKYFTFTLSVTDNEGGKTTDTMSVYVVPNNAPRVEMHFPPVGGIYTESTISAFGTVTPKTGKVNALTVTSGSSEITVVPDSAGNWRADGIDLPRGVADVSINVVAEDSNGNVGKAISTLKTSEGNILDNIGLSDFVGVAVDPVKKAAYALATGDSLNQIQLFSVDLITGKKSSAISSFANPNQGISLGALTTLAYAPGKNLVYVGSASADLGLTRKIISVDTVTGTRTLVSDDTKGSGSPFQLPYGLAVGPDNSLFVADNLANEIVKVNTTTGDRTIIQDANSVIYKIGSPLLLAADNTYGNERLFMIANAEINYILEMNPFTQFMNTMTSDSADTAQGEELGTSNLGLVVDPKSNHLFVAEYYGGITKVDIATGNRTKLMDSSAVDTRITYDAQNQLLYLLEGTPTNLYVADPVSGYKVQISRGND
jgi:hypothetical protein